MTHHDDEVQWEEHSLNFVEMTYSMDKRGRIENPDGYGKRTGQCGDTVEIFLTIENGTVTRAMFDIDGCQYTNATGNTAVHLIEGKSVKDAWNVTVEEAIIFLGSLPADHYHCAELAMGAAYLALTDYEKRSKKG